jgi:hypothetical protein
VPELIYAKEVPRRLGTSKSWVLKRAKAGRIPRLVVSPRIVRFEWQKVLDSIENHSGNGHQIAQHHETSQNIAQPAPENEPAGPADDVEEFLRQMGVWGMIGKSNVKKCARWAHQAVATGSRR